MTHFIFDCDDTLLDWESAFAKFCQDQGFDCDPDGPKSWRLGAWIGCSDQEASKLVSEFNLSYEFRNLKAIPGVRNAIQDLVSSGHSASVITSCGSAPAVKFARWSNLKAEFGSPFTDVKILSLGESKLNALSAYDPSCVFIEDNYDNARLGARLGLRSVCIRRSHNRKLERETYGCSVIWANSVPDALSLFT